MEFRDTAKIPPGSTSQDAVWLRRSGGVWQFYALESRHARGRSLGWCISLLLSTLYIEKEQADGRAGQ